MNKSIKVILFTDGACSGNPGPGGWGALLRYRGYEIEISGNAHATTNNRMEMLAVINGLEALKRSANVHIFTDSTYVMRGITEWLSVWKQHGWKTKNGNSIVKNIDLWQRLEKLVSYHNIEWTWVKGHSGVLENERVDRLAKAALLEIISKKKINKHE